MHNLKKPLLSISILVSNRIDTIRKCMESIKPLLTQFPCELIAVDTVGEATDGSVDVVREYTDKIYRFEWCNDFAAARNFGLEQCSGEWFMFMDDDEWFEDVSEIVDFFVSGDYKNYRCANYKIHNHSNYEGAYAVATLFRMVKREDSTRFVGRVHEYLKLQEPAKEFSAYIHHYGYVFDTEEERKAHSERNIGLLKPEFEKNPWDMHVRAQLLQEYMFMEEFKDDAECLCESTLKADKKYYVSNEFQWILTAYVRMANKENDFEKVITRAEQLRKRFPLSAVADVAVSIMELNARCKLGQYEKGVAILEHALERRKFLIENPKKKQRLLILDFATFLEDDVFCDLLRFGICCCYHTGRKERAEELSKERFQKLRNPVLTVSVLVSNRKETVRKCLESIQPLIRAVPSELIVVDTVGEKNSDGSLAIAKEYTEHIVPFVWCDDFAAARNAGLQAAKGEWFFYLDDDEWFENTGEIQKFFMSGEYLDYNSATYLVRNYKDKEGKQYSTDIVGRMVHRAKNTEFVGCVNETFSNLYLPYKAFVSYVHHYGFVYETAEEKKNHMQYVYTLMEKELEKNPGNIRNRAQLTAVLSVENIQRAIELCTETLDLCKEMKEENQFQWQIAVLFSLYETAKADGTVAEEKYLELQQEDLMNPVTEQVACYRMTRIWILQGVYPKAYPYAKRYFALNEEIAAMPEKITAEFEKYRKPEYKAEMLPFAAFCAWQAKEYADAWSFYENISWENVDASVEDSMWKLFAMAEEVVDEDSLFRIIKRIMTNETLKPVLGKLMQNPVIKQRINNTLEAQRAKSSPIERTVQLRGNYSDSAYRHAGQEVRTAFLSGKPVSELMEQYILMGRQYFEVIYRPERFAEGSVSWLPAEVQYNDILYRFLLGGKKELRILLDAARLCPETAQLIKAWLGELAQR